MAEIVLKINVDTSDIERAKAELDLVSRKDVRRMIREALSEAWMTWPIRMRDYESRRQ